MRTIDADRFRYELNILYRDSRGERRNGVGESIDILTMMPTIEARPVVRGEWLCKPLDDFRMEEAKCSVCGWTGIENYDAYINPFHFDFCPNCGADMRGEDDG